MHQFNTDFNGAMEWVCKYHDQVEQKFIALLPQVPSFGPQVDKELKEYILHLANWPRCNDCWNFESGRYFGMRFILLLIIFCIIHRSFQARKAVKSRSLGSFL
jgi:Delta6-protoilludene synthase